VPVMSTRVGNMPELFRHGVNGLFVEPDVADIAGKVALLRDRPDLRIRLGRAMLAAIQSWDGRWQAEKCRLMIKTSLSPWATTGPGKQLGS